MELIYNGQATGDVATRLLNNGMDMGALRPWQENGRAYVTTRNRATGKSSAVLTNAATLRKDEWEILDTAVVMAAQKRLKLVGDLTQKGLTYNIGNGMAKSVLQTQNQSDISKATISMDPSRQSDNDRLEFDLTNLPLPVVHKDFFINARQLAESRNDGQGFDTSMVELAGVKVAEEIEKLTIGNGEQVKYGGGQIYGLTNFPNRITTVDLTLPTDSGWTPKDFVTEVLAMRAASVDALHYGPWTLYVGKSWDQYLDEDYSSLKGDNTLRERVEAIQDISSVTSLDFLDDWDIILVQDSSDVIRIVKGMDITTVQWESQGGMRLHFKVMAIMVPQVRCDFNGLTGIVHASPGA